MIKLFAPIGALAGKRVRTEWSPLEIPVNFDKPKARCFPRTDRMQGSVADVAAAQKLHVKVRRTGKNAIVRAFRSLGDTFSLQDFTGF
jgi:hypothetical protein